MELQVVAEEMRQHCMVLVPVVLAALLALEGPGKILVVGVRTLRTAVVRAQLQVDMGQSRGQNLGWDWGQKVQTHHGQVQALEIPLEPELDQAAGDTSHVMAKLR